jgi:GNAT superfamily N-acetyltransferase
MTYFVRGAKLEERPILERLIAESARSLCAPDYTPEQIEGALRGAFGVDSELIRDGTYLVAEKDGTIVACGGWSRRGTLFGGDAHAERNSTLLDPQTQAAKVRAFFVHPAHARHGLGRMLLDACEAAARAHGFRSLELMATLTGQKLYTRCGFIALAPPVSYEVAPGVTMEIVPMRKSIGADRANAQ